VQRPSEHPANIRHSGPLAAPPALVPAPKKPPLLRQTFNDLSRHRGQQLLLGTLLGLLPSPGLILLGHRVPWLGVSLFMCVFVLGLCAVIPVATAKTWRFLGYGLLLGWVAGVILACALFVALTPSTCIQCQQYHSIP
jgi:hypothetical protein